jgi:RNA polymerase sigma-70 factor (ECF subfamily)
MERDFNPGEGEYLARKWAPFVRAVVRRLLSDADEVASAVDDALVQVSLHAPSLNSWSSQREKAWVARVARNKALDEIRRRKRRELKELEYHRQSHRLVAASPDQQIEDRDEVTTLVSGLGPRDAAAVMLADYWGFSHEESAAVVGISTNAFTQRVAKARRRARQIAAGRRDEDDKKRPD